MYLYILIIDMIQANLMPVRCQAIILTNDAILCRTDFREIWNKIQHFR